VAIENTGNLAGDRPILNPAEILATPDILEKVEAVCKRNFSAENDQNEAYIFVLDCLKDDNYKRLRAFKGKSKLSTYLHTLINSLVIDFRRKRYGRRRIPAAVVKLGRWAEAVYRLVCWQRFSFDDAYDFLQIDGQFEGSYDQFMLAIEPIRNAPCRENPSFKSIDEHTQDPKPDMQDTGVNPLELLVQELDRERRIKALKVIRETTRKLPEKDQLLVRLVFGSEHSLQAAAKVIQVSTSAARRRLKGLLIEYRERLLAVGIREP
jgi:RNA polymerase sigma factor (sigma-70 family)